MNVPATYAVSRVAILVLWALTALLIGLGLAGHGPLGGLSAISEQIGIWFDQSRGVFR